MQTFPSYNISYAHPEYEPELLIFRSFDIWSLACLYLKFVTWLLKSYAGIGEFSQFQYHEFYFTGAIRDNFFTLVKIDDKSAVKVSVSEEVIIWTNQLHQHEKCSALIHDLLNFVMGELLVAEQRDRCSASSLHKQLMAFLNRAVEDEDYLLKPAPKMQRKQQEGSGDVGESRYFRSHITWGENETKHYEVESPSQDRDEFISAADPPVREPSEEAISSSSKPKGWGAIAAGIMCADDSKREMSNQNLATE
ncbi:hypothetical protein BDZ45DRAFT_778018 [Acephala macrosclerotiorum]|nr:hypothetical protein BDZ45DRAFT_778018 [Acephala macrosclerotiorum]